MRGLANHHFRGNYNVARKLLVHSRRCLARGISRVSLGNGIAPSHILTGTHRLIIHQKYHVVILSPLGHFSRGPLPKRARARCLSGLLGGFSRFTARCGYLIIIITRPHGVGHGLMAGAAPHIRVCSVDNSTSFCGGTSCKVMIRQSGSTNIAHICISGIGFGRLNANKMTDFVCSPIGKHCLPYRRSRSPTIPIRGHVSGAIYSDSY